MFWVKFSTKPLQHFFILLMLWISYDF
jgi:hypothetical protein